MVTIDKRNGYGFQYYDGEQALPHDEVYFFDDAVRVIDTAKQETNCLVTAGPGTGKSHLVTDVAEVAQQSETPALILLAHINGGSKKGVENALYVLDEFTERHGNEGLVIVDNLDYYGYSGSTAARRYPLAVAHTRVASHLIDLINDDQAPQVCGTSHTEEWRAGHWLYGAKRPDDEVTPVAAQLIEAFSSSVDFTGELSEQAAIHILQQKLADTSRLRVALRTIADYAGGFYFRYLNHLPTGTASEQLQQSLEAIDARTARLVGGIACQ